MQPFDIHAAVGTLGHHLQRLRRAAHDAQAHKLEPRLFDDGFKNRFQTVDGATVKMQTQACSEAEGQSKAFPPRRPGGPPHQHVLLFWDGGYHLRLKARNSSWMGFLIAAHFAGVGLAFLGGAPREACLSWAGPGKGPLDLGLQAGLTGRKPVFS